MKEISVQMYCAGTLDEKMGFVSTEKPNWQGVYIDGKLVESDFIAGSILEKLSERLKAEGIDLIFEYNELTEDEFAKLDNEFEFPDEEETLLDTCRLTFNWDK